jgi:uncharacterized protein YjbI with pentapeptide repeats
MANPQHLAILKQGVEAWNRWRKETKIEAPDLSGADLGRANLRYANLLKADLSDANLIRADLGEAIILSTDLSRAGLSGADLITGCGRVASCPLRAAAQEGGRREVGAGESGG